jgi:hypothetical protein
MKTFIVTNPPVGGVRHINVDHIMFMEQFMEARCAIMLSSGVEIIHKGPLQDLLNQIPEREQVEYYD